MAAEPGAVQFSIGRVIGDSFGVLARNFVSFGILALLIGIVSLLVTWLYYDPAQIETTGEIDYVGLVVIIIVGLLVTSLTQAAIIYGTFQDLRGQRAGIGDCVARGLSSIVPVIVGSLLLSVAVGIGTMLLIIPGVILALMWWVYIPTIVVEGKSIMEGFGRSRELTRGRRWHILGLVIVVIILSFVVNFIVGLITGIMIVSSPSGGSMITITIIQYVFTSLVTAFSAVLVAVGYYYLRAEKEGVDANEIARIFD